MKKLLFTIVTFFFISSIAFGQNYYITQEMSVSQIQTELQEIINNTDIIFVYGSKTNADMTLALNLSDKIVVWEANYQSKTPFGSNNLISLSNNGAFLVANGTLITENAHAINSLGNSDISVCGNGKVQTSGENVHAISFRGNLEIYDNAQISGTGGEVIASFGDNATITVRSGSITTKSGSVIVTYGHDPKIYISGGYLCNDADGPWPAIIAYDPRPNTQALVHVSGTAKIEAKGNDCAIISYGTVKVSGNARVSNNLGGNENSAAIRAIYKVEITENAKVTASNNCAIYCFENVTISGNSIVEAKENAIAIKIYEEGYPTEGCVTVKNKAQVIAAQNYAISSRNTVVLNGGAVFAYGNEMSDVINNEYYSGATAGTVLAWNKDAGNTKYEKFSTDDLFISPEDATAHWDFIGGKAGISYANGTNTGFIPIEGVTIEGEGVKPITNDELRISVYPNPTSGKLQVTSYELQVTGVEVYDVYGRKCHVSRVTCHENIDIANLTNGIYFVKIYTEDGVVVKKVVKQ